MQIRVEQVEAMATAEMVEYVRELYPKQTAVLDPEKLEQTVAAARAKAAELGVTQPEAIVRFVSLAVLISPTFYQLPQIVALFQAPGFDASYKVHLVSDILIGWLQEAST